MPTYSCKTPNCNGSLAFPDEDALGSKPKPPDPRKVHDLSLTVIKDEPMECKECGKSYYEREVK